MIPYKRHDMLWLSGAGRECALRNIQNCIPVMGDRELRELIAGFPEIPAIVRRQEKTEDELISVGFSYPRIIDGVRFHIGCKIPLDCVIKHMTPFDVVKCDMESFPDFMIIKALVIGGGRYHIQVGCFGSAALQLITGLPYYHKDSDLDIYLRNHGSRRDLEQFYEELLICEKQYDITIDAEIEYPGQYGVKLKEVFSPGISVLGKGLYDVALLEK